MKTIALANLGTHDLKKGDGSYIAPGNQKELACASGNWTNYSLPILHPFLRAVKNRTNAMPVLVLFVTRQKNESEKIQLKDTWALGQLVSTWLKPGGHPDYQSLVSDVILSPAVEEAPFDYDKMLSWFGKHLPGCIKTAIGNTGFDLLDPPRLHVSITAGTPAMNTALMFKAFSLGVGRVDQVWHVNDQLEKAFPLQIGHVLAGEPLRHTFKAHLDRMDYEAAAELADFCAPEYVGRLLKALADLRRCDFHRVLDCLPETEEWAQLLSPWASLLDEGSRELRKKDDLVQVKDAVRAVHAHQLAEMGLQFDRGDYPEALTALYCLQESLVRILFEQKTNLPGKIEPAQRKAWIKSAKDFLQARTIQLKCQTYPDRRFMADLLQKIQPGHELIVFLGRIYDFGPGKTPLADLRNQSRVAHGFCPVTDADLKNAGFNSPDEIMKMAESAAEAVLGPLPKPPYPAINQYIMDAMGK